MFCSATRMDSWWTLIINHEMETLSALLVPWPASGGFSAQLEGPMMRSFDGVLVVWLSLWTSNRVAGVMMTTSSNENIFRVTGALCDRWPVDSPHKGPWRGALTFSLICAWTNGWANNRGAGDLRRHRAHYDAILMETPIPMQRYCNAYHINHFNQL